MSDLPICRLCGCEPWDSGDEVFHPLDTGCPMEGAYIMPRQKWRTLMGAGGEPVAWISVVQCVGPEYGKERYGKLPIQSLQPGYYKHVPLYTKAPAQRFQQIGFTRQDHIGKPSSTIVSDTKYRSGDDAGVYVPVFVDEGESQAPAVDCAVLRDAERYRWLRRKVGATGPAGNDYSKWRFTFPTSLTLKVSELNITDIESDFNNAIDSAIKGEG